MKRIELKPGGSFACECGKTHVLSAYVCAHWDVALTHTCDCGRRRKVLRGVVTLMRSKKLGVSCG